ncbi:rhomboid family intramembrane serine protease [Pseudochryseolinea flava]|uniref:Rhomboid family intramembrane serine protease n=1 Tax=Pseudochryseolinea flava TaxID=2059302 RepID=A0A364XYH2_9BACT|nr:rhomboid family intramembrane serine protease [Pseudochryseolinea flava]RAV99387.1 rhomboid family intramembrane serine protease [Pseudochryseolinea flava]
MLNDFKDAFSRYNNAHVQLIIINIVVFLALAIPSVLMTMSGLEEYFRAFHNYLAIPAVIGDFITRPWTILTYAFVHDLSGILHILFNMLTLYWFGRLFVEYLGSDKLIAVYVLGALFGGLFYLLAYNTIPFYVADAVAAKMASVQKYGDFGMGIQMVGASGAINAIVVAAATLLPDYTFFMFFIGPVRIKYIAAVVVFISFLGTIGTNAGGNIAHLGGALIGFIYIKQLQSGNNWGQWITVTLDWFRNLFKPRMKVKVTYRNQDAGSRGTKAAKGSNVSQEELDAILDKISAGGYESLTKDEKEKLFHASKK